MEQVIRRVDFSWCLEDPVVAELPGHAPFWIVRRETLDQLLSDQAIQAGAKRSTGVQSTSGAGRRLASHGNRRTPLAGAAVVIADGWDLLAPTARPGSQTTPDGHHHVGAARGLQPNDGSTRFEFGLGNRASPGPFHSPVV